jgi:uncharacterized protein YndB with AHSA1/START domain
MTADRTERVTIHAPPSAVWTTLLAGGGYARWHPRLEWLVFEGGGEPGTVVTVKPKHGRQTAFIVRDAVPERLLALETGIGPLMRLTVEIALARDPAALDETQVTATVSVRGLLAGLGLRYGGRALADGLAGDLAALAAAAETTPAD